MAGSESSGAIPSMRMAMLLPYLGACDAAGISVQRLLADAGIPPELADYPDAAVPFASANHSGSLAYRRMGTEHLGLWTSLGRSVSDYGPYGQLLQNSLTLHDYFRKGIALYNMVITGQRIRLSDHGDELRFNIHTRGGYELLAYQLHLETLVITMKTFREAQPG